MSVAAALLAMAPRIVGAPTTSAASLEIELRLGAAADGRPFSSGIQRHEFERVVAALEADVESGLATREADIVSVDVSCSDKVRYTFSGGDATRPHHALHKEYIDEAVLTVGVPRRFVRLAVALEREVDANRYDSASELQRRTKRRTTFAYGRGGQLRVDMTQVETVKCVPVPPPTVVGGRDPPQLSYECEIEFVCPSGRAMSLGAVHRLASQLESLTQRVLEAIGETAATDQDKDATLLAAPFVRVCASEEAAKRVRRRVRYLSELALPGERRLAGAPMPVALRRAHLQSLAAQCDRYYVSDKPDGVRLQLYACATGVYAIGRTQRVYEIAGADRLQVYAKPELLLDGEFVRHGATQRYVYLAFDMYALDGEWASSLFLSERLQCIAMRLVAPLRASERRAALMAAREETAPVRAPLLSFDVIGKQFWPLRQIETMLAHVRHDGVAHSQRHYYVDERRRHAIDGLLFTRNERGIEAPPRDILIASDDGPLPTVLKWKYADLHAIDLRVVIKAAQGGGSVALTCATQRGEVEVVLGSQFAEPDRRRLLGVRAGSIVEVAYDSESRHWLLVGVREKSEPNYLAVMLDTMLAAQERITLQELCNVVKTAPLAARPAAWPAA